METDHNEPPDLITLSQLKQVAGQTPQPYRIHAQIETRLEKNTSSGSPFYELKLVDAGDSMIWRVFDNNPLFHEVGGFKSGLFVELTAHWLDTGKYGIEPRQARLKLLTDSEKASLLAGDSALATQQSQDFEDIKASTQALIDPRLRGLCALFLERHGERFKRTAAARENHHARRGGLVEHVAQMMRSATALSSVYPHLNRDLLIAGILFHDSGKLWENAYPEQGFSMPYHMHGEMLGHITLGLELVNKLWRELLERPESTEWTLLEPANDQVRLHLLHLIASHHGELQYGSPVLPKTPEAIMLHYVDNLDAKLEMLRKGYENSRELAPGVFERFRPWPVNIVSPLPSLPRQPPSD
jgi:3'-5' exoribonuclease